MGLDIGIISIEYLERPSDIAYEFAWELAVEASTGGYMYGEGNNWGPFTRRRVRRLLESFSQQRSLTQEQTAEIQSWVDSLPWDGDDIELHFNW